MKKKELEKIKLWSDLTFKTIGYRKNFDIIIEGENIITEYNGNISKLRMVERKLPEIIGEYSFSTWDVRTAKLIGIDVSKLMDDFENEILYNEISNNSSEISLDLVNKIILIHNVVIAKKYRGLGVLNEFIEMIYRDFYVNDNTKIFTLALPIQYNKNNLDYYTNHKYVKIKNMVNDSEDQIKNVIASDYYDINEFIKNKPDRETNEYKIFSIAKKCGFNRINESNIFLLNPMEVSDRIKKKWKDIMLIKKSN